MLQLQIVKDKSHPIEGDITSTSSPIYIKGGDNYISTSYCNLLDQKLEDILSGDGHPDGWPYSDRVYRFTIDAKSWRNGLSKGH